MARWIERKWQDVGFEKSILDPRTTAVVICDANKVDMTAGNDSDWLKRTLTLVARYEEVEDCNKDPCIRLLFARCFLLLPRE